MVSSRCPLISPIHNAHQTFVSGRSSVFTNKLQTIFTSVSKHFCLLMWLFNQKWASYKLRTIHFSNWTMIFEINVAWQILENLFGKSLLEMTKRTAWYWQQINSELLNYLPLQTVLPGCNSSKENEIVSIEIWTSCGQKK